MATKLQSSVPTVMQAVVVSKFGDSSVLQVKSDTPTPKISSDEALIKVAAIGINPVETYIRSGNYGRLPKLPYIPGNDMCGVVVKVGTDVKRFKLGDKVASFFTSRSGAYAEYSAIHQDFLLRIPDNFEFDKGAAIGTPYFTAYKALFLIGKARPCDTILIHGATGGVGIACCQLALSQGMFVIGTAGSSEGMDLLNSIGVNAVVNHKVEGYMEKILKATENKGVNVIVEMLSNVNLNEDLKILSHNGTVAVVGCRGSIEINPRLLMTKESNIKGVGLFNTTKDEFTLMRQAISAGIEHGWIKPVVGTKYTLNQASNAHNDIISNPGAKGKMVIVV